jgi:hypothetical protein
VLLQGRHHADRQGNRGQQGLAADAPVSAPHSLQGADQRECSAGACSSACLLCVCTWCLLHAPTLARVCAALCLCVRAARSGDVHPQPTHTSSNRPGGEAGTCSWGRHHTRTHWMLLCCVCDSNFCCLLPAPPQRTHTQVRALAVTTKGVQLPGRHLYLLERLEDKVAAVNGRIASWKQWTAAALAAAAAGGSSDDATPAAQLEWAPVGAPAQVGRRVCVFRPSECAGCGRRRV